MIRVENDGQEIVGTNYWSTEHAARGFFYLTVNAAAFRLLVPEGRRAEVPEMLRGARYAVVSRGPWPAQGKQEAIEILFEDGSDSPYALHLSAEQCDRLPALEDHGRTDLLLSLWAEEGKLAELPARYRQVKRLPWLKPWDYS